jgi:hypothetical protein
MFLQKRTYKFPTSYVRFSGIVRTNPERLSAAPLATLRSGGRIAPIWRAIHPLGQKKLPKSFFINI